MKTIIAATMMLATTMSFSNQSQVYTIDKQGTKVGLTIMEQLIRIKELDTVSKTNLQSRLVSYATKHVTEPYTWGGNYKRDKFDCSSLVQGAYASIGIKIPRTTITQFNGLQKKVNYNKLQIGDLLYYLTDSSRKQSVTHVVMYIGNGKVVEAKSKKKGIIISKLTKSRFVGARRVL